MASDSDDYDTWIHHANASVHQGQFDRAVTEFTEAIRCNPESPLGYLGRGVALAKLGKPKQAVADATEAIRLNPNLASAYRNRGRDRVALGDFKRAIADFTEAIRLEPENADAYCDRATIYNRLSKYALAMTDAATAIRLAPQQYLGHDARGWAYFGQANQRIFTFWRSGNAALRASEYRQAVADFTEALRLNPGALDCHHGRALAYRKLGDAVNAARDEEHLRHGLRR
jgi:tetratricopeptide (TPR) repeat protein